MCLEVKRYKYIRVATTKKASVTYVNALRFLEEEI